MGWHVTHISAGVKGFPLLNWLAGAKLQASSIPPPVWSGVCTSFNQIFLLKSVRKYVASAVWCCPFVCFLWSLCSMTKCKNFFWCYTLLASGEVGQLLDKTLWKIPTFNSTGHQDALYWIILSIFLSCSIFGSDHVFVFRGKLPTGNFTAVFVAA